MKWDNFQNPCVIFLNTYIFLIQKKAIQIQFYYKEQIVRRLNTEEIQTSLYNPKYSSTAGISANKLAFIFWDLIKKTTYKWKILFSYAALDLLQLGRAKYYWNKPNLLMQ